MLGLHESHLEGENSKDESVKEVKTNAVRLYRTVRVLLGDAVAARLMQARLWYLLQRLL